MLSKWVEGCLVVLFALPPTVAACSSRTETSEGQSNHGGGAAVPSSEGTGNPSGGGANAASGGAENAAGGADSAATGGADSAATGGADSAATGGAHSAAGGNANAVTGGAGAAAGGTGNAGGRNFGGSSSTVCHLAGCGPAFTLDAPLPVSFAEVRELGIDVCRNAQCLHGTFANLPAGDAPVVVGAGIGITFPDGVMRDATHSALVDAFVTATETGLRLTVDYVPWDMRDMRDGDVYKITLARASGAEVAAFTRTVDYLESHPNGPGCGPQCFHAAYVTDAK